MNSNLTKRDFLKLMGVLTTQTILTTALAESFFISTARGDVVPIQELRNSLGPDEAIILVPTDSEFAQMQTSFNRRTSITPTVRVLCLTDRAVSVALVWAKQNSVALALRCGGHSYEGFSQSAGLVIDTRFLNSISYTNSNATVVVGGGIKLGDLNSSLIARGLAVPLGTCPTVGVSGHASGGGYGLLARAFGLACDNLVSLQIVTADGRKIVASASSNPDLFWACRGGGGGSFGVITQLEFKTHKVSSVSIFKASWLVEASAAVDILQKWQQWAPQANSDITSLIKISKINSATGSQKVYSIKCIGQTIGAAELVINDLTSGLFNSQKPDDFQIRTVAYGEAVKHFAGTETNSLSVFMKGKSDYLKQVMSTEGLQTFVKNLPEAIAVIFDSYGGQLRNLADNETAFCHRSEVISSIQYYSEWGSASATAGRLERMRNFYQVMRPYVSGGAYVNYCDLDLTNWAEAYWGANLPRLKDVKAAYDPENIFKHAQSIPAKR